MTLLSIITINYNNRPGLRCTLDSLKRQSRSQSTSFEWILIDAGSTDGSVDEARDSTLPFPHLLISEPDDGIYAAMNKGVSLAKGKFVNFLNSGDCICSTNGIISACEMLITNSYDSNLLIMSHIKNYGTSSAPVYRYVKSKPLMHLHYGMPSSHQSFFYNIDLLRNVPFRVDIKYAADYTNLCELYSLGKLVRVLCSDVPYSIYDMSGATNSPRNFFRTMTEHVAAQVRFLKHSRLRVSCFWLKNALICLPIMALFILRETFVKSLD